ncbi:MAG TPA: rod shape-determining protein MreD [Dongiaceae bacterium]|nr:rod shape-determining protein MreD [Dongiaceae bacterium]
MNEAFDLRMGESHIEVHKFHGGTILLSAAAALILQAFLPAHLPKLAILDLPLLITIYFALSRRNPSTGLLLGTIIGLLQDSLSKTPLGLFGIAKTVIGYLASSIGARLDTEHPAARFALTAVFFVLHQGIVALIQKLLLAQPQPWFTMRLLVTVLVNSVAGVLLYFVLDRLRKS